MRLPILLPDMYAHIYACRKTPLSTPDKKRFNVPSFSISSALKRAVQQHNLQTAGEVPAIIDDQYGKCLEKLSECAKIRIQRTCYKKILHLGLSIEAIESAAEVETFSCKVRVHLFGEDEKNYHYKINFEKPIVSSQVKSQDFVEIHSEGSIVEVKVTTVYKDHLLAKTDKRNE